MTILDIKHIEDCFDGSSVKELLLSSPITSTLIQDLGSKGHLQYFPHFARPFFKLRITNKVDLKGIEGNNTIRIRLRMPLEKNLQDLIDLLEKT